MDKDFSPESLQNKVQFDLRFYNCRHANENIQFFTRDTFEVKVDIDTGLKYIAKIQDEHTKNHNDCSSSLVTGSMTEIPGSKFCPVASFEKYVSKLSPGSNYLWQRPKTLAQINGTPNVCH